MAHDGGPGRHDSGRRLRGGARHTTSGLPACSPPTPGTVYDPDADDVVRPELTRRAGGALAAFLAHARSRTS
ncbi:hypothetical protein [Streptomyces xantholiticus]|uniref:hypothetical protein n=1 Tax=Streptomyces xantholiticus TaxID=68285 RepID=UPI001677D78D|nr:hypothetical protein [Streptomyces xantholiticus]